MSRPPPPTRPERIDSIDWVRGAVMVLMLLDHARDYLHSGGFDSNPLDPATTSVPLYLTRWVTHLCAPTFVFLAGMSARLQLQRGVEPHALTRFLWTRGLVLIGIELLVLRPMIFPDAPLRSLAAFLQVLWVLGWSMVALAALLKTPTWFVAGFGAVMVLFHNLLDGVRADEPAVTWGGALGSLLHQANEFPLGPDSYWVIVRYPLVPWIGVMALGYVAGGVFALDGPARRRILGRVALGLVALFLVLRGSNVYGDPRPWAAPLGSAGEPLAGWRTALAFFDVEKYPPSLDYLAITLGLSLGALALIDGRRFGTLAKPVITIGRVPLFFYVLQWPLLGLIGWAMRAVAGIGSESVTGFGLPGVYLGWTLGLLVLYPACRTFAGFRRRSPAAWLSYL
jgi:uncharacterized membrane protein